MIRRVIGGIAVGVSALSLSVGLAFAQGQNQNNKWIELTQDRIGPDNTLTQFQPTEQSSYAINAGLFAISAYLVRPEIGGLLIANPEKFGLGEIVMKCNGSCDPKDFKNFWASVWESWADFVENPLVGSLGYINYSAPTVTNNWQKFGKDIFGADTYLIGFDLSSVTGKMQLTQGSKGLTGWTTGGGVLTREADQAVGVISFYSDSMLEYNPPPQNPGTMRVLTVDPFVLYPGSTQVPGGFTKWGIDGWHPGYMSDGKVDVLTGDFVQKDFDMLIEYYNKKTVFATRVEMWGKAKQRGCSLGGATVICP